MSSDGAFGSVATYLQVDVPAWIEANLHVSTDRTRWAIGGLSDGGTCAMQVVTRDPTGFPTVLNMSGERHPTIGNETPEESTRRAFGGDWARYQDNDPLSLLARHRYEEVAGIFSIGAEDTYYRDGLRAVYEAARAAGMDAQWREYPGGHTWEVWQTAFADQLPWLGSRLRLTPP